MEEEYKHQAQRHEAAIQDYSNRLRDYESDALRSKANPQEPERIAALSEENRILKEQMATSWNQINNQMARLDEEHARFADEVRIKHERELDSPLPVMSPYTE